MDVVARLSSVEEDMKGVYLRETGKHIVRRKDLGL